MTLRRKSVILILSFSLGMILALSAIAAFVMLRSVATAEQIDMQEHTRQVQTALSNEITNMSGSVSDWALWDDTYAFVQGNAPNYVQVNLPDSTLAGLRYNMLRFTNGSGTLVYETAFDTTTRQRISVPNSIATALPYTEARLNITLPRQSLSGLMILPEGPMLVMVQPIQDSTVTQPVRGTLLVGRYLNAVQSQLGLANSKLYLYAVADSGVPDDVHEANLQLNPSALLSIRNLDERTMAGYWMAQDILGQRMVFKLEAPRGAYPQAVKYLGYFVAFLVLFSLIATLALLGLLQRFVLMPLARLSADVRQVGLLQNISARVQVRGHDESAHLATDVNDMLDVLWRSEKALRQSEKKYRDLVEQIPVVVYEANIDEVMSTFYMSPLIETLLGYPYADWLNDTAFWYKQVHPDDREKVVTTTLGEVRSHGRISQSEYRMVTKDGSVVWIRDEARLVCDEEGKPVYLKGAMLDITESKEAEARLRYLSTHDVLTGLHNRAVVEETIQQLQASPSNSSMPVSFIVADVDSLKTINDAYGHATGDALLRRVADILNVCVREHDVLGRMGGDEFVIVLPNTNRAEAESLLQHIHRTIETHTQASQPPQLGLSLGIGTADHTHKEDSLIAALQRADRAMYQNKIARRPMHVLERWLGPRLKPLLKQQALNDVNSFIVQSAHWLALQHEQPLHQVEASYQQFIEQLPFITYVCLADELYSTLYVSKQIEDILGLHPDEWLADPGLWLEQVHPQDRERVLTEGHAAPITQQADHMEYRMMTRAGKTIWIHDEYWSVLGEMGEVAYVQGVMMDITDRHRAEERGQAFSELGARLSATTNPQEAARIIVGVADRLLGWDACFLNLYSLDGGLMLTSLIMLDEINGQRTELAPIEIRPTHESLSHKVLTQGKLMINAKANPQEVGLVPFGDENRLSNSLLFVPVRNGSRDIGLLSIQSYKFNAYTEEDLDTLQALADHCGGALERIWAEQQTRKLLEELQQANQAMTHAYESTLAGWSKALDLRDKVTEGHTQRVTEMAVQLAHALELSDTQLTHLRRGALLHDIGKLAVPDHILFKSGPLTDDEWIIMRQHPNHAKEMLAGIDYLQSALEIPLCHHERWDGQGYPQGLRGEAIPLSARIFAVVDVWDALRSNRPYRDSLPDVTVRDYLRSVSGTQLDPHIVQAFLHLLDSQKMMS